MEDTTQSAALDLTVDIITAYLSKNQIEADKVPQLIGAVHKALSGLGQDSVEPDEVVDKPTPSQIRKSLTDSGLVSFIDGRTYKSLKRHLASNGFTPEKYRETFGLKSDYPMVAPAYSRARSEMAKAMGLGAGGRKAAAVKGGRKPRSKAVS